MLLALVLAIVAVIFWKAALRIAAVAVVALLIAGLFALVEAVHHATG